MIVAVVDTGCDLTHPDLKANFWVNPGEIPGNGIDDDGNGVRGRQWAACGSCLAVGGRRSALVVA